MENQNPNKQSKKNIFKGNIDVIIIIVVIGAGIWLYNYSTLKAKCERQVGFVPAVGKTEGIPGAGRLFNDSPAQDSYFSWGSGKFESREVAVRGCMRSKKDN